MATPTPKHEMATAIHNTALTLTNSEMASNDWGLEETLSNIGFPMYFAFDRTGNIAIIGCPFPMIEMEMHQSILNDVKRQLVSNGFNFYAFGTQNCIYAVPNPTNKPPTEHTEQEKMRGKRMLMTQICDIEGNSVALCTDFQGKEGGFIKDNQSVDSSEPQHIIWASATDCPVTFQAMQNATAE